MSLTYINVCACMNTILNMMSALFGVIPDANTIRVLIPYKNITNICHKLIIYRH